MRAKYTFKIILNCMQFLNKTFFHVTKIGERNPQIYVPITVPYQTHNLSPIKFAGKNESNQSRKTIGKFRPECTWLDQCPLNNFYFLTYLFNT